MPDRNTAPAVADAGARADRGRAPAARELSWRFEQGPFGPTDVLISIPAGAGPEQRHPVLVTFHGRGESRKGSRRGVRGWLDDYRLREAMAQLASPPLDRAAFHGFVSRKRLGQVNRALGDRPFEGLIVVCPYLPDVLRGRRAFAEAELLAAFVTDALLPRVYAETPAIGSAASTGVDGVSLGGRAALLVGLSRPHAFGAVGALQAALSASEVERFARLARRALSQNPKLSLRLLTSERDAFLRVNQRLSRALRAKGVPHDLSVAMGTHGYRFNRGPGGLEMLLFHDRALRGVRPD